ncbi:hypothetical protein KL86DYS1_10919 [uncultured Dysgonomonas sp.]|uniref:Uncharacterized protein n=1 Tax=uncultured Dysgonomonas sp. TaxID=206096 RepID=A0A212J399_9BACT|nr:hypothetical protein KL86DYS1_10919 [uncultured Dysgonomonas sp.]
MNWSEAELKIGGAKSALAKYKPTGALEKSNIKTQLLNLLFITFSA